MDGVRCREHALEEHAQAAIPGVDGLLSSALGSIDRAISRSRDPLVMNLGKFVSGVLSGRPHTLTPEENQRVEAELRRRFDQLHARAQQQQRSSQSQQRQQRPPPPPPSSPPRDPEVEARMVMGFAPKQELTKEIVQKRKQALAKVFHPDLPGGSTEAMAKVNNAADLILAKLA